MGERTFILLGAILVIIATSVVLLVATDSGEPETAPADEPAVSTPPRFGVWVLRNDYRHKLIVDTKTGREFLSNCEGGIIEILPATERGAK